MTAKQIADHELAHERLRQNPGLAQNIEQEIRQDYTEEEFDRVIDAYISKMRGIVNFEEGMSDREYDEALQRVKDEIICDAYAGINAFGAHAEQYQEQTQRVMQRRGVIGRKENENAAALARRGAGGDGERYSIARTADNKPFVEVEQDILAGGRASGGLGKDCQGESETKIPRRNYRGEQRNQY